MLKVESWLLGASAPVVDMNAFCWSIFDWKQEWVKKIYDYSRPRLSPMIVPIVPWAVHQRQPVSSNRQYSFPNHLFDCPYHRCDQWFVRTSIGICPERFAVDFAPAMKCFERKIGFTKWEIERCVFDRRWRMMMNENFGKSQSAADAIRLTNKHPPPPPPLSTFFLSLSVSASAWYSHKSSILAHFSDLHLRWLNSFVQHRCRFPI